jgi:shikimate kinase
MKRILLGYMGSGKSALGNELSKRTGIPFVDLDSSIVEKEGRSIADIFEQDGEIYFRKIESQVLGKLISETGEAIIAVGGGTPCYGNNMLLISENSLAIYLRASVNTLVSRLAAEQSQRPLIAKLDRGDLPEFIAKHLFERTFFYEQAHKTVVTDGKSLAEIADEAMALFE